LQCEFWSDGNLILYDTLWELADDDTCISASNLKVTLETAFQRLGFPTEAQVVMEEGATAIMQLCDIDQDGELNEREIKFFCWCFPILVEFVNEEYRSAAAEEYVKVRDSPQSSPI